MRIVGGRHRGRRLKVPKGLAVRPTADRIRESLFNILTHGRLTGGMNALTGARVLDAFCGTGALGLEARSRGAAHVVLMDNDAVALAACRANIRWLGEEAATTILDCNVLQPPPATEPCSVMLMDPPYGQGWAVPALLALAKTGWIAQDALIVAEISVKEPLAPPPGFASLDERRYGKTRLNFLRFAGGD